MTAAVCHSCGRSLAVGESAWADDWKVVTPEGVRAVARYTCDGCNARKA